MKSVFTTTAIGTMLIVGGMFGAMAVSAQESQPCVGENCPAPQMQNEPGADKQMQNEQGSGKKRMKGAEENSQKDMNATGDQNGTPRKKRTQSADQNKDVDVDVDVRVGSQQSARRGDWRFDPNRHERRRSKSARFHFYLDGYWYDEPYWEIYAVPSGRLSCRAGRAIVSERFNRVRVVECNGRTYTYLGRRQGDTYRILLNARTGRIVGRSLI